MPYKKATPWKQVGDVVLTNTAQEVALPERTVLGDLLDDEGLPTGKQVQIQNPLFTKHRNASSRIWLKNGQTVRILVEIDGAVDAANPLAVGTASCGATEWQSFYVRVRQEPPQASAPIDPALEVGP